MIPVISVRSGIAFASLNRFDTWIVCFGFCEDCARALTIWVRVDAIWSPSCEALCRCGMTRN